MIAEDQTDSGHEPARELRPKKRFCGILVRRERWGLSAPAKLVLFLVGLIVTAGCASGLYPFLAQNRPVSRGCLVVEGWLPTYLVEEAARRYNSGTYQEVIISRGLYQGRSPYESGEFHANYVADKLQQLGVPREKLAIKFFQLGKKDRTYHAALAVRDHFLQKGGFPESVEVVTVGPHARRSRLLFERALGGRAKVGVVALADPTFDPRRWWQFSAGWREVPFEFFAYCYVRFLFWPEPE